MKTAILLICILAAPAIAQDRRNMSAAELSAVKSISYQRPAQSSQWSYYKGGFHAIAPMQNMNRNGIGLRDIVTGGGVGAAGITNHSGCCSGGGSNWGSRGLGSGGSSYVKKKVSVE